MSYTEFDEEKSEESRDQATTTSEAEVQTVTLDKSSISNGTQVTGLTSTDGVEVLLISKKEGA